MGNRYGKIREDEQRYKKLLHNAIDLIKNMYSEEAHFIYELIQNAEDEGASEMFFTLTPKNLVIKHNGQPFDARDVEDICGVGESLKAGDLTKIGTFGIGFKSVYMYTSSPEIHSGDEHFCIKDYVQPHGVNRRNPGNHWTTLFDFPFDSSEIEPIDTYQEILDRLNNLGARTLLFLRNIKRIEFTTSDGFQGVYSRHSRHTNSRGLQVNVKERIDNEEKIEHWLVFKRSVPIPDKINKKVYVNIGFQLKTTGDKKVKKIVRTNDSPLVVFFPTDKETNLGFLIQGPYRTTPARDNIPPNDDWNKTLIKETAILLVEDVLPAFKKMGLLTVDFLEVLPIRTSDFPNGSMFRPIYDKVRETFCEKELLPTANGEYILATNAILGRGKELVELLSSTQLSLLFKHNQQLQWLSTDITDNRQDIYIYLTRWDREEVERLIYKEIRATTFVNELTKEFLQQQSDAWILRLYQFFEARRSIKISLRYVPFIRLQDDTHVTPFNDEGEPIAYLPSEGDTDFPIVKRSIVKDKKAFKFLKDFGIPEVDVVEEVLKKVIPKYDQNPIKVTDAEHKRDIQKILLAFKTNSKRKKQRLQEKLKESSFVHSVNSVGQREEFKKPNVPYIRNDKLSMYFDGNEDFWFVDPRYDENTLDMLRELDVKRNVFVKRERKMIEDILLL